MFLGAKVLIGFCLTLNKLSNLRFWHFYSGTPPDRRQINQPGRGGRGARGRRGLVNDLKEIFARAHQNFSENKVA